MKILFIEDNQADIDLITAVLKGEDCELEFAKTFQDGVTKKTFFSPDVVVLDVGLPDSTPFQTLRNVKQLAGNCAVVILTGDESSQRILEATQCGVDDFMFKSVLKNGSQLMDRLLKAWVGYKTKNTQTSPLSQKAIKNADITQAELLLMLKFQNDDAKEWKDDVKEKFDKMFKFFQGANDKSEERHILYMGKFGSIEGKQDHTNGDLTEVRAKVKVLEDKNKQETETEIKKQLADTVQKDVKEKYFLVPRFSKSQIAWIGSFLLFFGWDAISKITMSLAHMFEYIFHLISTISS